MISYANLLRVLVSTLTKLSGNILVCDAHTSHVLLNLAAYLDTNVT